MLLQQWRLHADVSTTATHDPTPFCGADCWPACTQPLTALPAPINPNPQTLNPGCPAHLGSSPHQPALLPRPPALLVSAAQGSAAAGHTDPVGLWMWAGSRCTRGTRREGGAQAGAQKQNHRGDVGVRRKQEKGLGDGGAVCRFLDGSESKGSWQQVKSKDQIAARVDAGLFRPPSPAAASSTDASRTC